MNSGWTSAPCPVGKLPLASLALLRLKVQVGKGPRQCGRAPAACCSLAAASGRAAGTRDAEIGRSSDPGGRRRERDHAPRPSVSRARLPSKVDGARRPGVDGAQSGDELGLGAGGAPGHGRPPAGWRTSPVSASQQAQRLGGHSPSHGHSPHPTVTRCDMQVQEPRRTAGVQVDRACRQRAHVAGQHWHCSK